MTAMNAPLRELESQFEDRSFLERIYVVAKEWS